MQILKNTYLSRGEDTVIYSRTSLQKEIESDRERQRESEEEEFMEK